MKTRKAVLAAGILLLFVCTNAQIESLKNRIENVLEIKNATIGIAIIANEGRDTLTVNGNSHFPMQSVFKFPIALAVLSEVDKGTFSLDQKITFTKEELIKPTWSPIGDKYPDGGSLTIAQLLEYTVSQSDNNGCDILLKLIGGPEVAENFLKAHGFTDISIKINERIMHQGWDEQFKNWSTPAEMTDLLMYAYRNKNHLLSEESYNFIWKVMRETATGMKRLRGQLPADTIVAHKTGTSGTNDEGITAACNDAGVILLPDGNPIYISVFVSNSAEDTGTNEKIISDIAKLVWDYYIGN